MAMLCKRNTTSEFLFITAICGLRQMSTRQPGTVFIQKNCEVPIISVTEKDNVDIIGPPDPVSNLRPIIRRRLQHETTLQQKLREMQDATQLWNQQFWIEHNTKFIVEKQKYVASHPKSSERTLTADEMSEFYKKFLDKNWKTHVLYNFRWYKKNFELLTLALKVSLQGFTRSS